MIHQYTRENMKRTNITNLSHAMFNYNGYDDMLNPRYIDSPYFVDNI